MKQYSSVYISIFFILIFLSSCNEDDTVDSTTQCSASFFISIENQEPSQCGKTTGSLQLKANGGEGEVLFQLGENDFQQNATFQDLAAGLYQVSAKDEKGCIVSRDIIITDETDLEVLVQVKSVAGCESAEGVLEVSAIGGTGTYEYAIDESDFMTGTMYENLTSGTYKIEVRDEDGCVSTASTYLPAGISFTGSIADIISMNCAITACHVPGAQEPNFMDKDNIIANAERIKIRTSEMTMPPSSSGRSLSEDAIRQIACWVEDGAPDN